MRKTIVVAALLLSVVSFTGAALAQQAGADLEKKVTDLMVEKLGDDAKTIKVAVIKEKFVLRGVGKSRTTAELCKEVAVAVPGVKDVDNQVESDEVKSLGAGKAKQEMADSKVETAVESALKKELGQHAKTVDVEVTAGVALLRGKVPDQNRKDLALKTATGITGVTKVIDLVSIGK